jgi:hypothetical protein
MKNNTPNSITCKQQKHKKITKTSRSKSRSSKTHDHQLSPLLVFFVNTSINTKSHSLGQSHPSSLG